MMRHEIVEKVCKENRFRRLHSAYIKQRYGDKGPQFTKKKVNEMTGDLAVYQAKKTAIKEAVKEGFIRSLKRKLGDQKAVVQSKAYRHANVMRDKSAAVHELMKRALADQERDRKSTPMDFDQRQRSYQKSLDTIATAVKVRTPLASAGSKAYDYAAGLRKLPQFKSKKGLYLD